MSLHYILDGYNIIRRANFSFRGQLKDARDSLLRFIKERKPCGSSNNKVTVVFDGREGIFYMQERDTVEVIFTKNESADEHIKRMVEGLPNPKQAVVVSDDRDIALFIRSLGARPMGVMEFLEKGQPKVKSVKMHHKAELSHTQAERITEELKKIWL